MPNLPDPLKNLNAALDPKADSLLDRVKASPYTVPVLVGAAALCIMVGAWVF